MTSHMLMWWSMRWCIGEVTVWDYANQSQDPDLTTGCLKCSNKKTTICPVSTATKRWIMTKHSKFYRSRLWTLQGKKTWMLSLNRCKLAKTLQGFIIDLRLPLKIGIKLKASSSRTSWRLSQRWTDRMAQVMPIKLDSAE